MLGRQLVAHTAYGIFFCFTEKPVLQRRKFRRRSPWSKKTSAQA